MIKNVKITNHLGESITFELSRPESTGIAIASIEGLGPTDATVNMTDVAMMDGALFNSSRLSTRNIVFELMFLWFPLIEDARHLTYKYFPVKKPIEIEIETDRRKCYTIGYVERNEPSIFSQQEGCQISILCPSSYFYATGDAEKIIFSGIQSQFEFPFSNESLSERLISLGEITHAHEKSVWYDGDAETGCVLTFHALGPVSDFFVYKIEDSTSMRIDTTKIASLTGSSFGTGDEVIITTIRGDKSVQLLRNGQYINIINAVDRNASWIQLDQGINTIGFSAASGLDYLGMTLEYRTAYEGV